MPFGHAEAAGHAQAVRPLRGGDAFAQALGDVAAFEARRVAEHQQELLAAPAREQVVALDGRTHELGQAADHLVAGGVAVRVVDALEVIDVDEDQRHREGLAVAQAHDAHQLVGQPLAIERARERIGARDLGEAARFQAQRFVQALQRVLAGGGQAQLVALEQAVEHQVAEHRQHPHGDDAQAERGRRDQLAVQLDALDADRVRAGLHLRAGGERDLRGVAEIGRLQVQRHRVLVDPPLRHREPAQRHFVAGRVDGRLVDQLVDLLRFVDADLRIGRVEVAHVDAHALLRLGAGRLDPQPHRVVAAQVDAFGGVAEIQSQLAERPLVAGAQIAIHAQRAVVARHARHALAAGVHAVVQRPGHVGRADIDHQRRVHAELVPQQRNAGEREQDDQQSTEDASVHGGSGSGRKSSGQTEIGRRHGNLSPWTGSLHGRSPGQASRPFETWGKRGFVDACGRLSRRPQAPGTDVDGRLVPAAPGPQRRSSGACSSCTAPAPIDAPKCFASRSATFSCSV